MHQEQVTVAESKAMEAEMQCHEMKRSLADSKRLVDIAEQKLNERARELDHLKGVIDEKDVQLKTVREEVDRLVKVRDEQIGKLTTYETALSAKDKNIQSLTSIISGLKKTSAKVNK